MIRKATLVFLISLMFDLPLSALGFSEDPQEQLTKTWTLAEVKTLEIRGEIVFELVSGPQPQVTVRTTRALFDQLTVANWWGAATVAIESGLRGPRELGVVQVRIELPSLRELTVLDRSSGQITWPTAAALLRVGDESNVTLTFEGTKLNVEASWLSAVTLKGATSQMTAVLRHQARIDARKLQVEVLGLTLDEGSAYQAGQTGLATGSARHRSRLEVLETEAWQSMILRENSVLLLQTE